MTFLKGFFWQVDSGRPLWGPRCRGISIGPSLGPEFPSPGQVALEPGQLLAEFSFWPRTGRFREIFVRSKNVFFLAGG